MEGRDQLPELRTLPGGVACQNAGSRTVEQAHTTDDEDSLELVEDALNSPDGSPPRRPEFQKAPWKNYFLVERYRYRGPLLSDSFGHGTAFLTDLVRVENGKEYITFLTAGHVLFECDCIKLKHSSDLLKGGEPVSQVKDIIDLRNGKTNTNGFFRCPKFRKKTQHTNGPCDYGAIFVRKEYLKLVMDDYEITLDHDLFHVRPSNLQSLPEDRSVSVFMAGYPPKKKADNGDFTYLAKSEGKYRRRDSLPAQNFIEDIKGNSRAKVPEVDGHTADARAGMSGSPIVLGEFPCDGAPSTDHLKVIAIHLGGVIVDDKEYAWSSDAPPDFKEGKGLNFARPLTQDVLDDLHLVQPGSQSQPVDEPDAGLPTAQGEDVAGPENVTKEPVQQERDERDAGLPTTQGEDVTKAPVQREREYPGIAQEVDSAPGKIAVPHPARLQAAQLPVDGVLISEITPQKRARLFYMIADDFQGKRREIVAHLLSERANQKLSLMRSGTARPPSERDLLYEGLEMWFKQTMQPCGRELYDSMVYAKCDKGEGKRSITSYQGTLKLPENYRPNEELRL